MSKLFSWRAVLAPLGVASTDGRTLLPAFAVTFEPPQVFMHDGLMIGRVHLASVDAGDPGTLIAAGTARDIGNIADRMAAGELIPGFDIDDFMFTTADDGSTEVGSGRLRTVHANPAEQSCWPGLTRFEIVRGA